MPLPANILCPAEALEYWIIEKNISKEELAKRSNLSLSTIKRAFSRKKCNILSRNSVIAICFGLELNVDEKNELLDIFYPEEKYYDELLEKKLSVGEANARLFEKGYDFLGQYPETSHYIKNENKKPGHA